MNKGTKRSDRMFHDGARPNHEEIKQDYSSQSITMAQLQIITKEIDPINLYIYTYTQEFWVLNNYFLFKIKYYHHHDAQRYLASLINQY